MTEADTVGAVEALYRRLRRAPVSSSAEATGDDAELRALIEEAESTEGDRARWRAACAELADLLRGVEEELAQSAVVRTPGGAATVVGWGGAVTALATYAPPALLDAHAAAVRQTAQRRLAQLALFTTTMAAATRIAALTSGSVWVVLPVAWRLVRAVRERATS